MLCELVLLMLKWSLPFNWDCTGGTALIGKGCFGNALLSSSSLPPPPLAPVLVTIPASIAKGLSNSNSPMSDIAESCFFNTRLLPFPLLLRFKNPISEPAFCFPNPLPKLDFDPKPDIPNSSSFSNCSSISSSSRTFPIRRCI